MGLSACNESGLVKALLAATGGALAPGARLMLQVCETQPVRAADQTIPLSDRRIITRGLPFEFYREDMEVSRAG